MAKVEGNGLTELKGWESPSESSERLSADEKPCPTGRESRLPMVSNQSPTRAGSGLRRYQV